VTIRNEVGRPLPYHRRPAPVEAVQLSEDCDWESIATWCGGSIHHYVMEPGDRSKWWIWFNDPPRGESVAHVGRWIVKSDNGLRVMDDEAFQSEFEPTMSHPAPGVWQHVPLGTKFMIELGMGGEGPKELTA
jgi:hypothetical protein